MILYPKRIGSAEKCVHLEEMMYEEAIDRFTVRVADTMEGAIKLVEIGFEFHAIVQGHQLFTKRK